MISSFKKTGIRFLKDETGATAIEYGLIVALISLGLLLLVNGVTADNISATFNKAADGIRDGKFDDGNTSS